jgi:hypothetical protein
MDGNDFFIAPFKKTGNCQPMNDETRSEWERVRNDGNAMANGEREMLLWATLSGLPF